MAPSPAVMLGIRPLAAILAGGRSRRFGAPKALAEVGGRALVERVRDALAAVVEDPVIVTGDAERFAFLGLPARPDLRPGMGPLAGLQTALRWAAERGRDGALVVACDLPFLEPDLLRAIVRRAAGGDAAAVVPEGPEGRPEPLCAWYSLAALAEVERRLERGELAMAGLATALGAARIPLPEVRAHGSPDVLFHNVNTPGDRLLAERIAGAAAATDARS